MLFFVATTSLVSATGTQMSSTTWHVGDTITISGDDLEGTYVQLKKLCFSPDVQPDNVTCFGHYDAANKVWINDGDPYLGRWERNILTFSVPPNLPPHGNLKLILYNDQEQCCHRALQNQPLMGASKPATTLGGFGHVC